MKQITFTIGLLFILGVAAQTNQQLSLNEINRSTRELIKLRVDSACTLAFEGRRLHSSSSKKEVAINNIFCGTCYRMANKNDSAFYALNQSIEYFIDHPDPNNQGLANWYMAKVWMNLQRVDQARKFYQEAIGHFEKSNNVNGLFKVLNEVGVSYGMQNKMDECLDYFKQALELAEQNKIEEERYRILHNISLVYASMDDYDRALIYNRQVLSLTDTLGNEGLLLNAITNRAQLYAKIGKTDSSKILLSDMVDWAKAFDNKIHLYRSLIRYYTSQGDDRNAIKYLRRILRNEYDQIRKDVNLIKLATLYKSVENYDSAFFFTKMAYDYSLESQLNRSVLNTAVELSGYYKQKGDNEKSLYYSNKALAYKDSVSSDEISRKISDLTVQLETRDKINEITQLKLQADLIIAEKRNLTISLGLVVMALVMIFIFFRSKIKLQRIESQQLKNELDHQKRELQAQAISMIRLITNLNEIEESLKSLKPKSKELGADIKKIVKMISLNQSLEKEWESFNESFTKVHTSFFEKLKEKFPNLSVNETRMCALVKMNMTNLEMSSLLNIESGSVRMAKYRLKKKLKLSESDELSQFITNFGGMPLGS